jgi:hypothetical protein
MSPRHIAEPCARAMSPAMWPFHDAGAALAAALRLVRLLLGVVTTHVIDLGSLTVKCR